MSATAPPLSVLMSVYNGAAREGVWLRAALLSVLSQSFSDFEFIVLDNGSTDASPAILDEFTDSRLRRLRNETVVPRTPALNQGLSACRGRFVCVLDADDIALPGRFAAQVAALEADPGLQAVGGAYQEIDPDGRVLREVAAVADIAATLAFNNILAHSAICYRREAVLAAGGYPLDYAYCQDYGLWVALARRGRLAMLAEPCAQIRMHPLQQTSHPANQLRNARESYTAIAKAAGLARTGDGRRAHCRARAECALRVAAALQAQGKPVLSLLWWLRALRLAPLWTLRHERSRDLLGLPQGSIRQALGLRPPPDRDARNCG